MINTQKAPDYFMVAVEDGKIDLKRNKGFEIPSAIAEAVSLSVQLEIGEPVLEYTGSEGNHIAHVFKHEIVLGERLASGSFADVYEIKTFALDQSTSECSKTSPRIQIARDALVASSKNLTNDPTKNISRDHLSSVDNDEVSIYNSSKGKFVVKHLRYKLVKDFDLYKRAAIDLAREAKILSSLRHPNVVGLRGISAHGVSGFATTCHDGFFLILNRLNETLEDKMKQWRTNHNRLRLLNIESTIERLDAMIDIANALAYIHQHKVIHRDLKPENFAINDAGRFQIIDFGFARKLPEEDTGNPANDKTYNLTGCTGSFRYMAPEVAAYELYNEKADVYSSSLIMYEILTLKKVFEGFTPIQIASKVHYNHKRPGFPARFPRSLDGVRRMIKEAWSPDMSIRPPMESIHHILVNHSNSLLVDSNRSGLHLKSLTRFNGGRGAKPTKTAGI
mmetsp:Transcript_309/g.504  ORF Transcript_309/g.504 Transcript_309/m.504 type:complete len:449 (-) Transcript_309:212-1558(-)